MAELLKRLITTCAKCCSKQRTGQRIIRNLKENNIIIDESEDDARNGHSQDSQRSQIEELIDSLNLLEGRATIPSLGRMRLHLSKSQILELLRIENIDLKERQLPEWFSNDDYLLQSEIKIRK